MNDLDNTFEEVAALFYLLSSHVDLAGRDGESEPFPEFPSGVAWLTKHMSQRLGEKIKAANHLAFEMFKHIEKHSVHSKTGGAR